MHELALIHIVSAKTPTPRPPKKQAIQAQCWYSTHYREIIYGWVDGQMDGEIFRIRENITPMRQRVGQKK
jgi:hypothetical protein